MAVLETRMVEKNSGAAVEVKKGQRLRIAGKSIGKVHDLSKPQGVRGRNSDNALLRKVLGWEPAVSLEEGLTKTYFWIQDQLAAKGSPVRIAAD